MDRKCVAWGPFQSLQGQNCLHRTTEMLWDAFTSFAFEQKVYKKSTWSTSRSFCHSWPS
jgi:hypothetical protein